MKIKETKCIKDSQVNGAEICMCNTCKSKRSRKKRNEREKEMQKKIEQLEKKIEQLEKLNSDLLNDKKTLQAENMSLKKENTALKIKNNHLEPENNITETVLKLTTYEDDHWGLLSKSDAMLIDQEKKRNSDLEENYNTNEASLMKRIRLLNYMQDLLLQNYPADKVKGWRLKATRVLASACDNELKMMNDAKEKVSSCYVDVIEKMDAQSMMSHMKAFGLKLDDAQLKKLLHTISEDSYK